MPRARVSIPAAALAAGMALLIGVTIWLLACYFGGRFDTLPTALIGIFLAFPLVLVALASIAGPSLRNVIPPMALTGWMAYSRVIHSAVLSLIN